MFNRVLDTKGLTAFAAHVSVVFAAWAVVFSAPAHPNEAAITKIRNNPINDLKVLL
jgi:hypothetical protein